MKRQDYYFSIPERKEEWTNYDDEERRTLRGYVLSALGLVALVGWKIADSIFGRNKLSKLEVQK